MTCDITELFTAHGWAWSDELYYDVYNCIFTRLHSYCSHPQPYPTWRLGKRLMKPAACFTLWYLFLFKKWPISQREAFFTSYIPSKGRIMDFIHTIVHHAAFSTHEISSPVCFGTAKPLDPGKLEFKWPMHSAAYSVFLFLCMLFILLKILLLRPSGYSQHGLKFLCCFDNSSIRSLW